MRDLIMLLDMTERMTNNSCFMDDKILEVDVFVNVNCYLFSSVQVAVVSKKKIFESENIIRFYYSDYNQ